MKYIQSFLLVSILILSIRCARRGNPSGGLKDEDAPVTIKTIPAFNTINFNQNEIKIYFDEYIKLKDIHKNLIISPPLKYPADITPLGIPSKKLVIKIQDTLLKNTTYTFNFGESIVDNNEGNVLKNFKYVFSTGNYIDSLSIKGTITDALSRQKETYVSVLLFEANASFNDSTIYKEKPLYVTNSLDTIAWDLSNLKKGKYHLLALKSENDLLFQPKSDKIAFLDTIISIPTEQTFSLNLFKEVLDFKILKPIEVAQGHLIFPYEGDAKNLQIKENLKKTNTKQLVSKTFFERSKDTLHYFFKSDTKIDSLFFDISNGDYTISKKVILRSKLIDSLKITKNLNSLNFKDTLTLITSNPLEKFEKNLFTIIDKDTINVDFLLKQKNNQQLQIIFNQKENQTYKINMLPNALTDFFNQSNKDTLNYNLRTKKRDKYGSINLKITKTHDRPIIVQLLNSKESVLEQQFINSDQTVEFQLLPPTKYLIRIIYDTNHNKIWDTGNYLLKTQPEKIYYFNKEIEVKENWFVNESIELE